MSCPDPGHVCCDVDDRVEELMDLLLGDLIEQFNRCEAPHCRASLAPGSQLAWDNCCDGPCAGGRSGQLSVQVDRIYPSTRFPSQAQDAERCRVSTWAAEFVVTSLRCAHVMQDDGAPPKPADLTADTRKLLKDARILRSTIECAFGPRGDECDDFIIGAQTFLGPNGGCAGVQQTVTVRVGCQSQCQPTP